MTTNLSQRHKDPEQKGPQIIITIIMNTIINHEHCKVSIYPVWLRHAEIKLNFFCNSTQFNLIIASLPPTLFLGESSFSSQLEVLILHFYFVIKDILGTIGKI